MKRKILARLLLIVAGAALLGSPAPAQVKDYLSTMEADKIRDAETTSERIKLFVSFAEDRLKKIQYEMSRTTPDRFRNERLNDLLNGYAGCLDDAAELVDLGIEKSEDIGKGVKELQKKGKEYLAYLQELAATGGAKVTPFKDNLEDAIAATQDALKDAEKASKEISPPPVRRKP